MSHLRSFASLHADCPACCNRDQMQEAGLIPELEAFLDEVEAIAGIKLPLGYNPDLKFMSHLWEDVPHVYRPLLFYLVMEFLELLCHIMLRVTGFQKHSIQGIEYYTANLPPSQPLKQQQCSASSMSVMTQQESLEQLAAVQGQQCCIVQGEEKPSNMSSLGHDPSGLRVRPVHSLSSPNTALAASSKGTAFSRNNIVCDGDKESLLDGPGPPELAHSWKLQQQQQQQKEQQEQQHKDQRSEAAAAARNAVVENATSGLLTGSPTGPPLVVMHGVGAGLLPYLGLVFAFAALKRPMLLPLSKHVSMRLTQVGCNQVSPGLWLSQA